MIARLKMTTFYQQLPKIAMTPMHSSNPEPLSMGELDQLLGEQWQQDFFDPTWSMSYVPVAGNETLRHELANCSNTLNQDDFITTSGAQEALACCCEALMKPGERVIVPTPCFEPLIAFPQAVGCDVVQFPLTDQNFDPQFLEELLKQGADWLVLNFPHNPTGMQISAQHQKVIVELCEQYQCKILADEVFRGLELGDTQQLPGFSELTDQAVSIEVMSKAYALPGVRLGWISTQNSAWRTKIIQVKSSLSICTGQFDDYLATLAVQNQQAIFQRNKKLLNSNKTILDAFINRHAEKLSATKVQGACTTLVTLNKTNNAENWLNQILQKTGKLFLPGTLFYAPPNSFRMGFGRKDFEQQLNKFEESLSE
ncbi:MAG: pyridoxal phosphate-dependent aminotransferase [bacterium]